MVKPCDRDNRDSDLENEVCIISKTILKIYSKIRFIFLYRSSFW